MKLAYIELAGFRGAKNLLRIDVPAGFLVIVGRNGTGKSTVCDAIEFAFNGSIREHGHKEKGESYADYLWWRGTKPASERYVRLGFHDSQGVLHEITRTPDGIDAATQDVLALLYSQEGAPSQPLTALARTSLLRDEEITALSVDLPESDRYKFVRDALGTVHLSDLDDRLGELRKRIDDRLRKETLVYERLRDKVADNTARLSDLRGSVASGPENILVEKEMRNLLNSPEATLSELLESARRSLGKERTRLDRLHRLLTSVQELDSLRQSVESKGFTERQATLEAEVANCEKRFAELKSECDALEVEVKQAQNDEPSRAKHADLCNTGESIGLLNNKHGPLCGSHVSDQHFRGHIAAVRSEIQAAASGLVDLLSRQQHAMNQKEAANNASNDARQRLAEHLATKKEFEKLSAQARKEAESQGIPVAEGNLAPQQILEQIETLRAKSRRIESGIGWLESSSVTDMIQTLESEVAELKTQANEAFAATTRSDKASGKLKEAQKIAKSLLGEIIDEQLAELSPLIEELYKRLRPHVEWTHIKYRLRGDVRRMLSFEVGEGLNPSFVFSSGQRRAAGLAFLLAVYLSRPWCNFESLILDDPVQHVDDFRALNLTEVLTAIRKDGRQIVCCVEDEALGQLMCRRLRSGTESDGRLLKMQYDCESGVTKSSEVEIGPSRQHILVPA
jgi:chromosome segregation protein